MGTLVLNDQPIVTGNATIEFIASSSPALIDNTYLKFHFKGPTFSYLITIGRDDNTVEGVITGAELHRSNVAGISQQFMIGTLFTIPTDSTTYIMQIEEGEFHLFIGSTGTTDYGGFPLNDFLLVDRFSVITEGNFAFQLVSITPEPPVTSSSSLPISSSSGPVFSLPPPPAPTDPSRIPALILTLGGAALVLACGAALIVRTLSKR